MTLDGRVQRPATAFSKRGPKIRGRERNEAHLAYIRKLPSVVSGKRFNIEACHIRYSDAGTHKLNPGVGRKPHDRYTVPLCADEHRTQHGMNERAFWEMHKINPVSIAAQLWAVSGDIDEGEKIIREARL